LKKAIPFPYEQIDARLRELGCFPKFKKIEVTCGFAIILIRINVNSSQLFGRCANTGMSIALTLK